MMGALFIFFVVGASYFVLTRIESSIVRLAEQPLASWRRLSIMLPMLFLLAGNLDGILSLNAYMIDHPHAVYARYRENQAWNADRFATLGLMAFFICPLFVTTSFRKLPWTLYYFWSWYVLWTFTVFVLLILVCRVPFRN